MECVVGERCGLRRQAMRPAVRRGCSGERAGDRAPAAFGAGREDVAVLELEVDVAAVRTRPGRSSRRGPGRDRGPGRGRTGSGRRGGSPRRWAPRGARPGAGTRAGGSRRATRRCGRRSASLSWLRVMMASSRPGPVPPLPARTGPAAGAHRERGTAGPGGVVFRVVRGRRRPDAGRGEKVDGERQEFSRYRVSQWRSSQSRSASRASLRRSNGPSTGPPTGVRSASQRPCVVGLDVAGPGDRGTAEHGEVDRLVVDRPDRPVGSRPATS